MPRMQVYLPDDLYRAVKERELPASDLLQKAVRTEMHRQSLLEETDRYLVDLIDRVGEPSAHGEFNSAVLNPEPLDSACSRFRWCNPPLAPESGRGGDDHSAET